MWFKEVSRHIRVYIYFIHVFDNRKRGFFGLLLWRESEEVREDRLVVRERDTCREIECN